MSIASMLASVLPEPAEVTIDIQRVVNEFVSARLELSEERKVFKEYEARQNTKLDVLEAELLRIARETGLQNFGTETHTAYRTTKTYCRAGTEADSMQLLIDYAEKTGDYGLFTSHRSVKHMKELIEEHVFGRQTTKALVEANTRYRNGDDTALTVIAAKLQSLTEFYPKHIEKEDKVFFPSSRKYFSTEEDQAMLTEFWEFDRKMIHEKYKSVVEGLET